MILPDLSRRCPAVDPDDHHLYGSLGCAAENLLLAARAAGLEGHFSYDASESSVQVAFEEAAPPGQLLSVVTLFDGLVVALGEGLG